MERHGLGFIITVARNIYNSAQVTADSLLTTLRSSQFILQFGLVRGANTVSIFYQYKTGTGTDR